MTSTLLAHFRSIVNGTREKINKEFDTQPYIITLVFVFTYLKKNSKSSRISPISTTTSSPSSVDRKYKYEKGFVRVVSISTKTSMYLCICDINLKLTQCVMMRYFTKCKQFYLKLGQLRFVC